jgi:carbon storage regulator
MLTLTRTVGRSIKIGEQITVKILDVRGRRVRLGIDVPREIEVRRQEASRSDDVTKNEAPP